MKRHFRDSWNVWRAKVNAALGTVEQIDASEVLFDNDDTDLTANDVQSAIEEVDGKANTIALSLEQLSASHVGFAAGETGMTADDVQEAIEEVWGTAKGAKEITDNIEDGFYVVGKLSVTVMADPDKTIGENLDILGQAFSTMLAGLEDDEWVVPIQLYLRGYAVTDTLQDNWTKADYASIYLRGMLSSIGSNGDNTIINNLVVSNTAGQSAYTSISFSSGTTTFTNHTANKQVLQSLGNNYIQYIKYKAIKPAE